MSNITLYLPDSVKKDVNAHAEIRWSEIVRQAIINKLKELKKLELLRKYVEKEPFTSADLGWMDENDWHPVDEQQMKLGFVGEVRKRSKGRFVRVKSVDGLFE
jgi:hypothetical protein